MKNKLLKLTAIILSIVGILSLIPSNPVFAYDMCTDANVPPEVKKSSGCEGASDADLGKTIQNIVNGIVLVLGLVAVVMIVIGGIMYMTSAGDSGKLKRAKDTILYAIIGLIICALAYAIANFAISLVNNAPASDSSSV